MSGSASSSRSGCPTRHSGRSRPGRRASSEVASGRPRRPARQPARHARLSRLEAEGRAPGDPRRPPRSVGRRRAGAPRRHRLSRDPLRRDAHARRGGRRRSEAGGALHEKLAALGVYRREERPWLPHLTVLRFRERPRLRPATLPPGWVSSDAAAFLSRLHPSGARYEVHDSFRLGG